MQADVDKLAYHARAPQWHESFPLAAQRVGRDTSLSPMADCPASAVPVPPAASSPKRYDVVRPTSREVLDAPQCGRLPSLARGFGFAADVSADSRASPHLPQRDRSVEPLSGDLGTFTLSSSSAPTRPSRPSSLTRHARRHDMTSNLSPRSSFSGPSGGTGGRLPPLAALPSRRNSAYDDLGDPVPRLAPLATSVHIRSFPSIRASPRPRHSFDQPDDGPYSSTPSSVGPLRRVSHAPGYTPPLTASRYALVGRYSRSSLSGPSPEPRRGSLAAGASHHDGPTHHPYVPHVGQRSPPYQLSLPASPASMSSPGHEPPPQRPVMHWRGSESHITSLYHDGHLSSLPGPSSEDFYVVPGYHAQPRPGAPLDYSAPASSMGWASSYPNLPSGVIPSPAGPPPPRPPPSAQPAAAAMGPPRPFKCTSCGAAFQRNHDLRRHCRIHLSTKPFACPECHKPFSRKDALNRHILVKGCAGRKRHREFRIDAEARHRASVDTPTGMRPTASGDANGAEAATSSKDNSSAGGSSRAESQPRKGLSSLALHRHSWAPTDLPMPPPDMAVSRGPDSPAEYTAPRRLSAARNSLPTDMLVSTLERRKKPAVSGLGPGPSEGGEFFSSGHGHIAPTDASRPSSAMSTFSTSDSVRTDPHSMARSSITALSTHNSGQDDWVPPNHPKSATHAGPHWASSYSLAPPRSASPQTERPQLPSFQALGQGDQNRIVEGYRSGKRPSLVPFADPWVPPS